MSGHSCPNESHRPREESAGQPPPPERQVAVCPESAASCCSTRPSPQGGAAELSLHTPPERPASGAVCSAHRHAAAGGGGGAAGGQYVRLNVGGALFLCPLRVLTRRESRLRDMFRGKTEVMIDREGWVLIDRSGKHFGSILNFLRDGSLVLPKSRVQIQEVLNEARYYGLQGLVLHCQSTLQKASQELPLCVTPVVTSRKEEDLIIRSSTKPVVKLVYNRSNNKYSYTSSSDDNLLKNIELFERLCLSFCSRVQFVRNVVGDEICCWSFYGQGRKLGEVCCTSIVYSTEKKHTKVEFPEARIYEETLNTLLYETVPLPDHTLLEATRRRYNPCGSHSEEDEGPGPGLALL
ncbi:hypothetical protein NL108_017712 [Boleophthalmus pectinirostris]|uniref:BTB/POZ domain-containing adapter for CUL3-mediated RhoA degradation protein 2 isoform X1 n=1 Tax=Boleophthalmus pectinirostris TaxID=150288 RepID=UPI00242FE287|nr:BTB/POZ domain-containing adapter for CUL3-mediated RhoA degradation protein 2 isoform X1 [Boleophthalmus pectinirostris]KAJ0064046.1 hypothetical protein NL108_017712 [Boleophthalmus pectinirostris]